MSSPSSPAATRLLTGLAEIADRYDVLLCDVWGVVHDGHRAFAEPAEALSRFRAHGGTVILVTNAPRPSGPVMTQLDGLGVPRAAYDRIVTSGDATVALIAARGSAPLHHVGPQRDLSLLEVLRRQTGQMPDLVPLEDAAYVLCTGFYEDVVETLDHYAPMLEATRARDLDMICANPDIVVHVGESLILCAGALAQRYAALGGRALFAGKPHAPIYAVALDAAAKLRGAAIDRSRVLAIGDGLPTDIAGARGQGFDSLFVTSGIHREETLRPDGSLDAVALDRFLGNVEHRPKAAIAALRW